MVQVVKQDSNATGLRIAEELGGLGVLTGSEVWTPYEPNSYTDFGGQLTTTARNPINRNRQRKKAVVTDLNATGGFNNDLTQLNMQSLLQGFFFADTRRKSTVTALSSVSGSSNDWYAKTDAFDAFVVGDLVLASGFGIPSNNGLKVLGVQPDNDSLKVTTDLATEASPPAAAKVVKVGHQFASSDVTIAAAGGSYPTLNTSSFDLTTLPVIPGEMIYIGDGADAAYSFGTAADNGWVRVLSIAAHVMTFDKTEAVMVSDNGTGKTIRIFFGHVLKNETGSLIKRRSYSLERSLGAPDSSSANEEAEYLDGSIASQLTLNVTQADKVTVDLAFVSCDYATVAAGDERAGTRPDIVDADAFNTSSDFSWVKLAVASQTDSATTPLFAYFTDLKLTVNNNVSPDKAVGKVGAFEISAGSFDTDGSLEGYFATVASCAAIRNNSDFTLHGLLAKNNSGFGFDVPLLGLSDGRLKVTQDQAIKIPVTATAAEHPVFEHTLALFFYDYLPDVAEG